MPIKKKQSGGALGGWFSWGSDPKETLKKEITDLKKKLEEKENKLKELEVSQPAASSGTQANVNGTSEQKQPTMGGRRSRRSRRTRRRRGA